MGYSAGGGGGGGGGSWGTNFSSPTNDPYSGFISGGITGLVAGAGTTAAPSGSVLGATTQNLASPSYSAAPAPDPYAQWGGQTGYNNLVSGFNTQKQNVYNTANEAASNAGVGLRGSILDFVDSLSSGQRAIDQRGVNTELAKRQGAQGVLGMVGRGIRSGGVMLANKNAGDSSASGALANAYGDIGRRQMANIGNQYATANQDIQMAQEDLGRQQQSGMRRIADSKTQVVNNIVGDARNRFAELDAAMAEASLPERIAIEQEKENVRQQVLGQLQQYDTLLSQETGRVAPMSQDARRAEATRLAGLGTDLGEGAFNFTEEVPAQFANTGPFASELPIFTFARGRRAT